MRLSAERGAMHEQCADGAVFVLERDDFVLPVCERPRARLRRDPVQAIDALAGMCMCVLCWVYAWLFCSWLLWLLLTSMIDG
jgi:hypothetical protein